MGNSIYNTQEADKGTKRGKNYIYWNDIVNSLIGRRLNSIAGGVDYNYTENTVTFKSGGTAGNINDAVVWNVEYNHEMLQEDYSDGISLTLTPQVRPHMHWEQPADLPYEFTLRYRIQYNGKAKTTAWSEMTLNTQNDSSFTYVSGTLNQISAFKNGSNENIIPLNSGESLSAIIQFQMWRTDSQAGDIEVVFVDCHAPNDRGGSEQEYVKEE